MSQYFSIPFRNSEEILMLKLIFQIMQQKIDLKNVTHVDTLSFAPRTNLTSLKTEVDKLDIDKLVSVPVDLNKFGDVIKNDVVKKAAYDKLVAKVNSTDTSGFVLKTKYQTDKTELEKKIPDVTDLVRKTKLTELENKFPDVSNKSKKKTALTAAENKIPDSSCIVKNKSYDTKITELENKIRDHNYHKYIATREFNTLAARGFNARLAQPNLIITTDFHAKLTGLNKKITSNKTKHLVVENEF